MASLVVPPWHTVHLLYRYVMPANCNAALLEHAVQFSGKRCCFLMR